MTRYFFYSCLIHAAVVIVFIARPFENRTPVYYGFDFIPGGSSGFGPAPMDMSPPAPPSEGKNTMVAPPSLQPPPTVSEQPSMEPPDTNKVQVVSKDKSGKPKEPPKAVPKQKKLSGPLAGTQKARNKAGTAPASGVGDTGGMGMGLDIGGVGLGSGAGGISKDFPYPWYVKILRRKLWEAWDVKDTSGKAAVIVFVINRDGSVTGARVEQGSGDSVYDEMAQRAVEVAGPFPPLPEAYTKPSLKINMTFKFDSN